MESKVLFGVLLAVVLLGSGCIQVGGEGTSPVARPETMHGVLVEFEETQGITAITLDQELYSCDYNSTTVHFEMNSSKIRDALEIGEEYTVYLSEGIPTAITAESEDYLEACSRGHDNDLIFPQTIVEGVECIEMPCPTERIEERVIAPGVSGKLTFYAQSRADYEISYQFLEAKVFDSLAEEEVGYCTVEFPAGERAIAAGETDTLEYSVICNEPIICQNEETGCDIHGENCVTRQRNCEFEIRADFKFKDLFGYEHDKTGYIQFIRIEGY